MHALRVVRSVGVLASGLENALPPVGWLPSDETVSLVSGAVAWLGTGTATPHQECRPRRSFADYGGLLVLIIRPELTNAHRQRAP
jgi:hypothetical protein